MDDSLLLNQAAQIVAGLLVLFLGRRLFWLFVGVVGFFFGLRFGIEAFKGLSEWLLLMVSILIGLVSAGLTILLQRLAVIIAGGVAGGMIAMEVAPAFGLRTEAGQWLAFVAGTLLIAVIFYVLFDPALIVFSALTGAVMIAEAFPLDPMIEPLLLGLLFIVGAAVQIRMKRGSLSSV